ncbi:MAG: rod shape-determining protein RodA [Thermodesulfobacteriota bacterium]
MIFDRQLLKNFGFSLIILSIVFALIGLLNLYSSSYHTGLSSFKKQTIWVFLGLVSMIAASFLNPSLLNRYASHIYLFSIFILLLVVIFGKEVAGAKSWFQIGQLSIQPSEFAKIALILIIARFYNNDFNDGPFGLLDILKPIGFMLILFILVMLQPDLGTGLILLLIGASMFLFMGIKKRSLLFILIVIIGLSIPAWNFFLKEYQKERIASFIDPYSDPLGSGYNSIQSQIAVGSGKMYGKGFISGSQSQLRFIPAQQTDFAFSVLAEEWGFLGSILTLLIYFLIILTMIDTAGSAKDKFRMLVCFGSAALFFWHAAINIGMVIGLLPVTGVPLLLLSYGGSSTITAFITIGIVLGIRNRQIPKPEEDIEL